MKHSLPAIAIIVQIMFIAGCGSTAKKEKSTSDGSQNPTAMADILEESLFNDILCYWYPRNIDSVTGGYISGFQRDWSPTERPLPKALVQQARHVWATAFILEHYPEKTEYLGYSSHGFAFLRDAMWDQEYGGFYVTCNADGTPALERGDGKLVYGQAFAVYGLSQYYTVSKNEEALELAKKAFLWMENAHDPQYGGYFENLQRNGSGDGLKDFNSSIHLMEALTTLYRAWPDSLVRVRMEEMFYLIRDTFVHPDGYLQLYFHPDWTLVTDEELAERSGARSHLSQHITYGHDVETAFLLLETAHELGMGENAETHAIAKRLVDHSMESGWDHEAGGFFDAGKDTGNGIEIIHNGKAWWSQIEGLNALLLMHTLYPDDPNHYYDLFLEMWDYIETNLIDHEYGGWYNNGLDTSPETVGELKSHGWKTTYHNARGMVHCIEMLRSL
ncbi:MAG: AGE family epimerase/isomerase [Bacteroidales bacterium]